MKNNIQYSIIYADIRPEITERLSLGILTIDQDRVKVYYSQKKLGIVKLLYTEKEYKAISNISHENYYIFIMKRKKIIIIIII